MEKQIVLREPIAWNKSKLGDFTGSAGKLRCFYISYNSGWYALWNSVLAPREDVELASDVSYHETLNEAKAKAEQLLTDWLRSIATITE